jgi:tetratricopeptide (TPR) repeat protein
MDRSKNKNISRILLLFLIIGLSAFLSWRFYKQEIINIGCVVADKFCSSTEGSFLCDQYNHKKYKTFCLLPVDIDEWHAYINANKDILDTRLSYADVREMMQQGKFAELDRHFNAMQLLYENHEMNEYAYNIVMESLRFKVEEMLPLYNNWLVKFPNSYMARFGRGATYYLIGWEKRGEKWARDTSKESMDAYYKYHVQAAEDLRKAVALHPKFTIAYRDMVSISPYSLGALGRDYWLAESIKYDPHNYLVRRAYIWKLMPRWGGGHQQMHEFAASALQHVDKNPLLRGLAAVEFSDKAKIERRKKRYADAIKFSSIALYHRPDSDAFHSRAYIYQLMKKYKESLVDIENGLKQDPDNIKLLHAYAWSTMEDRQVKKAASAYERLTKMDPNNASYWYGLGRVQSLLQNRVATMECWQKSHELEPENKTYHYWFARYAIINKVPVGLVKMRSYVDGCKNSKCEQNDLSWARHWLDCVDDKPNCEMPEHDYVDWRNGPLSSS